MNNDQSYTGSTYTEKTVQSKKKDKSKMGAVAKPIKSPKQKQRSTYIEKTQHSKMTAAMGATAKPIPPTKQPNHSEIAGATAKPSSPVTRNRSQMTGATAKPSSPAMKPRSYTGDTWSEESNLSNKTNMSIKPITPLRPKENANAKSPYKRNFDPINNPKPTARTPRTPVQQPRNSTNDESTYIEPGMQNSQMANPQGYASLPPPPPSPTVIIQQQPAQPQVVVAAPPVVVPPPPGYVPGTIAPAPYACLGFGYCTNPYCYCGSVTGVGYGGLGMHGMGYPQYPPPPPGYPPYGYGPSWGYRR